MTYKTITAASLAAHTQAVLQGGFILAKATGDPDLARESVDHLIRYVRQLFGLNAGPANSRTREKDARDRRDQRLKRMRRSRSEASQVGPSG